MIRCLAHHPEMKQRCQAEIKACKGLNSKTQKKFKPLYDQYEAMMSQLAKLNSGSAIVMKTVRLFLAAAGKLIQTISDKVTAQLQKLSDQKSQAARATADAKADLQGQAAKIGTQAQHSMETLKSVAQHFDGLKKVLHVLENGMEKVEQGCEEDLEDAETLVSGKMMVAGDALNDFKHATSQASQLADKMQGTGLDKTLAHAVSKHLCRGGATASKQQLTRTVEQFLVGDEIVSFFIRLVTTTNKKSGQVLSPRGGDQESLTAADLEACILQADMPIVQVAGMMVLFRDVVVPDGDDLPEWANDACEIIDSMLTPLIESVVSVSLCMLMMDVREQHPTIHEESYLEGMDDITSKMELLKQFAQEFRVCLENQELPDPTVVFELAVQDSTALCGGVTLGKKVQLLRSVLAVGSIEKDVLALQACRGRLAELRTSLQALRSSSARFPGSVRLHFGQQEDSEACFFWVHSFGEMVTEVRWSLFKREFLQFHRTKIDPGNFSKLLTRLRLALFKGDELGTEVVHVETICRLAASAANQNGGRSGTALAPWYDVAAVAMRRSLTKTRGSLNQSGHFSLLTPPMLKSKSLPPMLKSKSLDPPQSMDSYVGTGGHASRIV